MRDKLTAAGAEAGRFVFGKRRLGTQNYSGKDIIGYKRCQFGKFNYNIQVMIFIYIYLIPLRYRYNWHDIVGHQSSMVVLTIGMIYIYHILYDMVVMTSLQYGNDITI